MDDVFKSIVFVVEAVLIILGAIFVCTDHRHFEIIKKHCETQGYIQNETVRIFCIVEK